MIIVLIALKMDELLKKQNTKLEVIAGHLPRTQAKRRLEKTG